MTEASSTITWETIAKMYKAQVITADARIEELAQRANHWHDTAQMLKRQRDIAEEERDGWKERAMQSEQQRQSLRDMLTIAEGQRDQAKADAEHWKGEWAVVMGQLGGARADLTQRAEAAEAERIKAQHLLDSADCSAREGLGLLHCRHDAPCTVCSLRAEREALLGVIEQVRPSVTSEALLGLIDAALAVQPTTTTGETQ